MTFIGVLHRLLIALVLPALGYLLGATIFHQFYDQIETGDLGNTEYIAVAESCAQHGPVTMRGFGYWWTCEAKVTRPASGRVRTFTTTGFLEPEDIGRQVAVETTRRGSEIVPQQRSHEALGMVLLFPFGILWLFVIAWCAKPISMRYLERTPKEPAPRAPVTETFIWGSRKRWIKGKTVFFIFAGCLMLAIGNASRSLTPPHKGWGYWAAACVVVLVIIVNEVHRLEFSPGVTISTAGLQVKKELSWAEIHHVRMVDGKLVVQLHDGTTVTSRRFGDGQVAQIGSAMSSYSPVPYLREDTAPVPAP